MRRTAGSLAKPDSHPFAVGLLASFAASVSVTHYLYAGVWVFIVLVVEVDNSDVTWAD